VAGHIRGLGYLQETVQAIMRRRRRRRTIKDTNGEE